MIFGSFLCVILVTVLLRKKVPVRSWLVLGILFLTVDLYAASFQDMKQDLAPYGMTRSSSPVFSVLERQKAAGRLGRIYGFRSGGQRLPLVPSQNMLYGIADIGVYSPLVLKRYFETVGLLGNVNDSNFQHAPSPDFVLQRLPLLSFLDVSHILSTQPLAHADLKFLEKDSRLGSFLYENAGPHHPAYFICRVEVVLDWNELRVKLMTPHFDPRRNLLLEKDEFEKIKPFDQGAVTGPAANILLQQQLEDFEEWTIETSQAGFFVVPATFFAGWKATVNDQPATILKADGLFRAVRVDTPGRHKIQFRYKPFWAG